jgi:hypothetical protein
MPLEKIEKVNLRHKLIRKPTKIKTKPKREELPIQPHRRPEVQNG